LLVVGAVRGVTQLDDVAYVVSNKSSIINMYTAGQADPLGEGILVRGMTDPRDILACRHDRQLYVADFDYCIWRVSADDHSYVRWLPTESATDAFDADTLSLTSRGLLVTSSIRTLYEYSMPDRELLRVVNLPAHVERLLHAVETSRSTFVVSHRGTSLHNWQSAVSQPLSVVIYILHIDLTPLLPSTSTSIY